MNQPYLVKCLKLLRRHALQDDLDVDEVGQSGAAEGREASAT